MKTKSLDLDAPIYETTYTVVNSVGSIIAVFDDRETGQRYATKNGLRLLKTIKEVEG